jgi:hypothetical protein
VVRFDGLTPDQIARYKKTLWDGVNNKGQVSRSLLSPADVREIAVESAGGSVTLLAIAIPRAGRMDRPVHVGQNPFGGTYRRCHEGDYKSTDEDVRRMIADASAEPADHRLLPNFTIDDFDKPSLTQYRQRFRAAKGDHAWIALEDREFLERLGGWRRDRKTGEEGPTVAGLLMFGKDLAIRDPHAVPQYFVDYREVHARRRGLARRAGLRLRLGKGDALPGWRRRRERSAGRFAPGQPASGVPWCSRVHRPGFAGQAHGDDEGDVIRESMPHPTPDAGGLPAEPGCASG